MDIARVYGSASQASDWPLMPGFRFIHAGAGKNAADLLLCIDAMEMALSGGLESFVVATSDGDFTHLAQRLREGGAELVGLGEAKAPAAFRQACTAFVCLADGAASPTPQGANGRVTAFDRLVRAMIARHSQMGMGMSISELGRKMRLEHDTLASTLPEGNWRSYLSARPALYDLDPRGPEAMVRFRPEGFSET